MNVEKKREKGEAESGKWEALEDLSNYMALILSRLTAGLTAVLCMWLAGSGKRGPLAGRVSNGLHPLRNH